jgi:hypothetical protein
VGAVYSEPFSAGDSLFHRENTGKFRDFGDPGSDVSLQLLDVIGLFDQIPYATEQGIFRTEQGILSLGSGSLLVRSGRRSVARLPGRQIRQSVDAPLPCPVSHRVHREIADG